jgi:C-terminal processing protease CtpA/Prc
MSLRCRLVLPVACLMLAAPVVSSQQRIAAPSNLNDADRLYGLSLLWQEASYNFAFFDQVPQVDWDSTYRAFIPQVLESRSTLEYYRTLQRFLALLQDGHTGVSLPRELSRQHLMSYPWLLTRNVDGEAYVRNVGRQLGDEVPVGSVITSVAGLPTQEYARREVIPYVSASTEHDRWERAFRQLLDGPAAESVHVTVTTPAGERRDLTLQRDRHTRESAWLDSIPERPRFELRWLDDGIAYVALNTFNDPDVVTDFEMHLEELASARALVIDVRYNGGGNSNVGYGVAAYLTTDTLATSRWRTREHIAARKAWGVGGNDRYADYARMDAWFDGGTHGDVPPADGARLIVPTVVLQDHGTFSAAEDFLVVVDQLPQVTSIGRPSGGSTGQPLSFELPGGGRAWICTKRDTFPDGRDFVGVGIAPDIVVRTTVADVRAGRDPALDRAIEHLHRRLRTD